MTYLALGPIGIGDDCMSALTPEVGMRRRRFLTMAFDTTRLCMTHLAACSGILANKSRFAPVQEFPIGLMIFGFPFFTYDGMANSTIVAHVLADIRFSMAVNALFHRHAQLRRDRRRILDALVAGRTLHFRVNVYLMREFDRVRPDCSEIGNMAPDRLRFDQKILDAAFRRFFRVNGFMALIAALESRHASRGFFGGGLVADIAFHFFANDMSLVVEWYMIFLYGIRTRDLLLIAAHQSQQQRAGGEERQAKDQDFLLHKLFPCWF